MSNIWEVKEIDEVYIITCKIIHIILFCKFLKIQEYYLLFKKNHYLSEKIK